jgi:hypothetical protein
MIHTPAAERNAIATMAKRKIVAGYLGERLARRYCPLSAGARDFSALRGDGFRLRNDCAKAIAKING